MSDLFLPLTEEETDLLEDFLLDRIPDEGVTESSDEGIFDISTLDGFLTAVVSGPNLISVSKWLPAVWGDFEPECESEAQVRQIITLMLRHMNGITDILMNAPEEFEPMFMERKVKGRTYQIVDEWCTGYLRGVSLDEAGWKQTADFEALFDPILLFATKAGWDRLEKMTQKEVVQHQGKIAPLVKPLHAYWLEKRKAIMMPHNREEKIGRNTLCPCGSGKKFKHCCGSGKTLH